MHALAGPQTTNTQKQKRAHPRTQSWLNRRRSHRYCDSHAWKDDEDQQPQGCLPHCKCWTSYICIYIYLCIYVHICIYICDIYLYIYIYICIYINLYMSIYIYIYIYTSIFFRKEPFKCLGDLWIHSTAPRNEHSKTDFSRFEISEIWDFAGKVQRMKSFSHEQFEPVTGVRGSHNQVSLRPNVSTLCSLVPTLIDCFIFRTLLGATKITQCRTPA